MNSDGAVGAEPRFVSPQGWARLHHRQLPALVRSNFTNAVPTGFTAGTTDLLLFDLVIAGWNVPFSITLTDVDGDGHPANFATPFRNLRRSPWRSRRPWP
jgi:hypothetical protein